MSSNADAGTEKFACFGRYRAHPGRGEDLIAGYEVVRAQVAGEGGTEVYALNRSADDPDLFFIFEVYASREDFAKHVAEADANGKVDALNAATAERDFMLGVPVWIKN